MRFVFDENLPPVLAEMLDCFERSQSGVHSCSHLSNEEGINRGTKDEVWITELGQRYDSWCIVTKDRRIKQIRAQRDALNNANCHFVGLHRSWSKMKLHEQAWKFVKLWTGLIE